MTLRRPRFIAEQARRPRGLLGRMLGTVMSHETRSANEALVRLLDLQPGETVLEIGFGPGVALELAASRAPGTVFHGIDISSEMARMASRRCARFMQAGRLSLCEGTSACLPHPAGCFDKVFTLHTMYFWDEPRRHLSEVARVLKPGGRLFLAFREPSPSVIQAFPPPVYRFRAADEVHALLADAGLTSVSIQPLGTSTTDIIVATAQRL